MKTAKSMIACANDRWPRRPTGKHERKNKWIMERCKKKLPMKQRLIKSLRDSCRSINYASFFASQPNRDDLFFNMAAESRCLGEVRAKRRNKAKKIMRALVKSGELYGDNVQGQASLDNFADVQG